MNLDLGTISQWALDWLVDFNARKTMSLLMSLNDTVISESTSHKHLGVNFRTLAHGQNVLPKLLNQHG